MLKFFRQIRQRLIRENRFSKYLLYAIGEVVLIVIGIWIALQLNNWNSERLDQIESNKYLAKLEQEMGALISYYNDQKIFRLSDHQKALDALKFIESCGEKKEYEDSFMQTMVSHQILSKYGEIRNTYEEMIAVGAFSAIPDKELKSKIFFAFNELTDGQTQIDYYRDELGRASTVINNQVSFSYNSESELTARYEVANLCRDVAFRNAVVEVIDAREDYIRGLDIISSAMSEAREAIRMFNNRTK